MHEKEIIVGDPRLASEGQAAGADAGSAAAQAENGELPGAGTGQAATTSAEEEAADGRDAVIQMRARDGIRAWVAESGRVLLHMTPQAIVTAMTAAALAPVLIPLLAGSVGSCVVQQLLAQLGCADVAHMAGVMQEVVTRLKGESSATGVSEETMRNVVDGRLGEELAGPSASAFRAEIAQLLRAVNGVDEALRAAYSSDVQGLGDHVGRAVHDLSQTVTEFRALREDMLGALTSIQRDTTFLRVAAQDHGDELRRLEMNVALLRREVAISRPFMKHRKAESAAAGSLTMPERLVCPYPGLAAFGETDAGWFHGRERLTATMINRLRERLGGSSPLIVAGASGAGKSSVLRAGLIPELDTGGLAEPGSEHWPRVIMTPGPLPLRDLALRLADLAQLPASLVLDELAVDPARAPLIIRQALLPREERQRHGVVGTIPDLAARQDAFGVSASRRLILVIDQFEEVFTQCSDGSERKRFVDAICAAAHGTRHDPPAALVVTGLRAGFVEHCTAHPELEPALRDPLIVGPMNSQELRDAIELPARHAGLAVEAGLAATMLRDLGAVEPPGNASLATYDPGKLPLLAHALRETWERREGGQLTIAAYDAVGGIKDAIASKADDVYATFDDQSKQVTRRLLEHMVSVHADAEDTRRRMSRSALLSELPAADASIAGRVLDRLEKERLVTADQDTVQIAHEALLRYWPKLVGWVQENRAWRREQQRLTEHAREWEDGNRHPDRLLRGAHLAAVRDKLDRVRGAELGTLEAAFLRASEARQGRERARRLFVGVLIALVVLAAGFAAVAERNSRAVRQQQAVAQSAQSSELAVEASELRASDPQISLLLSLEAYRVAPTNEAVSSLLSAQAGFFNARMDSPFGAVNAVAYDPVAPPILATANQSGQVTLWNTTTRKMVATLPGRSPFYAVAFDSAGHFLAGAEQDGTITVWNARTPYRQVREFSRDSSAVDALAFSPDSSTLATAGDDGSVTLWRTGTWKIASSLGGGAGPVSGIAFTLNGTYLAAACADHNVRLWNLNRPSHGPLILQGHTGLVRAIAFSHDSRLLASGSDDDTVRLWDARSGAPKGVLFSGTAPVDALAFSPDGPQLASAGEDNVVRLWDVDTGTQTSALTGPASPVLGVAFSTDGHVLASADRNSTVGLWNIPAPPQPESTTVAVATSAPQSGGTLATAGTNQKIILWHPLQQRNGFATLPGVTGRAGTVITHTGGAAFTSMAVSPDGQVLATPAGTRVELWSTRTLKRIGILTAPTQVDAIAYRPGARHGSLAVIAAGGSDGAIYFWGHGKAVPVQPSARQLYGGRVNAVAFSPAGTLLAAGNDDGTILLARVTVAGDQVTPKILTQAFGAPGPVEAVAFSPSGRILASASNDGTVKLWNVGNPDNPTLLATLYGHTQAVISVAFSSDGETLASSAADNTIRIWSIANPNAPTPLATLTGLGGPTSVTFEPDSHIVVAAAGDGTPLFWDTKASEVANRICASNPAGSAPVLTPFLLGVTYRPVCPAAG